MPGQIVDIVTDHRERAPGVPDVLAGHDRRQDVAGEFSCLQLRRLGSRVIPNKRGPRDGQALATVAPGNPGRAREPRFAAVRGPGCEAPGRRSPEWSRGHARAARGTGSGGGVRLAVTVGSVSRAEAAERFDFLAAGYRGRRKAIRQFTHRDPDFVFWIDPDGALLDARDGHLRNPPPGHEHILDDHPDYGGFLRGRVASGPRGQLVVVYCRADALAQPGLPLEQFLSGVEQLPIPIEEDALVVSDNGDLYGTLSDCADRSLARAKEFRLVMPFPRVDDFRYGCVREAILAAHSHAVLGSWCGNANYSQGLYYVDNLCGETGIVAVSEDTCHGVLHGGDPFREYDLQSHLARVPEAVQPKLQELAEELDRHWHGYCAPTAMFWAEGDRLTGTEEFPVLYAYGFETLQHEILDDDRWLETVVEEEIDAEAARAIIQVARRYVDTGTTVVPAADELAAIFPPHAPARAEGIEGISDADQYIAIIKTSEPAV